MKKSIKIILTTVLLSVFAGTSIFAKSPREEEKNEQPRERTYQHRRNDVPPRPHFNLFDDECVSVIGTIKKISSDASLITITNTDGKDETFALTPFTKICIPLEENPDKKTELPPPAYSTATDLQKDDWVIVKTVATDTKTPVAGIIFVSKKTVEKNNI
ncbi:hypothetical protein [Treponema sp.]|uniref:hypothetical protein n=1 Tax=Treponema sp. TaxID=166 RepID=UPI003FD7FF45